MPGMDTLPPMPPDAFQEQPETGEVPLGASLDLLSETVGNLAAKGGGLEEINLVPEISAEAATAGGCGQTRGNCSDGCGTGRCV